MSAARRRRKAMQRRNAWRCRTCSCQLETAEDIRTARWTGECVQCQEASALRNLPAELLTVAAYHEQRPVPFLAASLEQQ